MAAGAPPPLPKLPELFRPLAPYLKHALQLEPIDPVMAYHCRFWAAQEGLKIRSQHPKDGELTTFILSLITRLEDDKTQLGILLQQEENQKTYVHNFALKVFKLADDEDRAGKASASTVRNYLAAVVFFDVCRQFGEPPAEVRAMHKYAKWKAADISRSLKAGKVPTPGPPGGEPERHDDRADEHDALLQTRPSLLPPTGPSPPTSHVAAPSPPTPHPPAPVAPMSDASSVVPSPAPPRQPLTPAPTPAGAASPVVPPMPAPASDEDYLAQLVFPSVPSTPAFVDAAAASQPPPTSMSPAPTSPAAPLAQPPPAQPLVPPPALSPELTRPSSGAPAGPPPSFGGVPPARSGPPPAYVPNSGPPQSHLSPVPAPILPLPAMPAVYSVGHSNYQPTTEELTQAEKLCRFAVSAIQFEDVPTAIKNLILAMRVLTGEGAPAKTVHKPS